MMYRIDIDGTILNSSYVADKYSVIEVNDRVCRKIRQLHKQGHLIVIETGRHWNHLRDTIAQLKTARIPYHALVLGKAPGIIVDDKALTPEAFCERQ
jgi:hydroxymethylpyrimidine pyrophosphatase-like HAD family hydrolase